MKDRATSKFRAPRFRPPWWLSGPHGQTIFATFFRRRRPLALASECLPTPDGDFLHLHHKAGLPGRPVLLVIHGMEGSAASHYTQGMLRRAGRRGWHGVAMEFRGVGPELNRAPRLYHSGASDDVAAVVESLARRHPGVPLYAVGFSLGANMLGKYLGEQGRGTPLAAAALVSPPFDLETCAPMVDSALFGLYRRRFLRGLMARALRKAAQFPALLDAAAIRRCRSLVEFDDTVTAPLHGFADAADYYRRCGCGQFLQAIRIPTLVIASEDDPLIPALSIPRRVLRESPWLHPLITARGGHLGFVEGTPWRLRYWAEAQAMRFFEGKGESAGGLCPTPSSILPPSGPAARWPSG